MRLTPEWVGVQGAGRGSGLVLSVMTNQYDLIRIAQRLSVFAPQTWDRRIWDSARGAGCGLRFWVAVAEADGSHREPVAFVPASGSMERASRAVKSIPVCYGTEVAEMPQFHILAPIAKNERRVRNKACFQETESYSIYM
jgi:hypothetical protein